MKKDNSDNLNDKCDCTNIDIVQECKGKLLGDEIVYDVADYFKVFGDSTRIKILHTLLNRELCVGDLSEILDMTQSATSHQLRVLRQNGLVKFRKEGKLVIYALDDDHVSETLKQGIDHICHKNNYNVGE